MSRMTRTTVKNLLNAREVGGYTLPNELVRAADVVDTLGRLEAPRAEPPRVDATAALLVAAVADGKPADLKAAGKTMHAEQVAHDAARLSADVLRQAVEQADQRLATVALDLADAVIRDHLQPAWGDLLTQARELAETLCSTPLSTVALMTAPSGVREAYAALTHQDERRAALRNARKWVNAAGSRTRH